VNVSCEDGDHDCTEWCEEAAGQGRAGAVDGPDLGTADGDGEAGSGQGTRGLEESEQPESASVQVRFSVSDFGDWHLMTSER
jgi:hypothetical protein